jgi:hypothetical protein
MAKPVGDAARPFNVIFGTSNGLVVRVGESGDEAPEFPDFCSLRLSFLGRLATVGDEIVSAKLWSWGPMMLDKSFFDGTGEMVRGLVAPSIIGKSSLMCRVNF